MPRKRPHLSSVTVNKNDAAPLYQQIYQQLATAIEQGVIEAGHKLPSLRGLAAELGVGRITVQKAYEQLCVEGYVTPAERSGYVVNEMDTAYLQLPQPDNAAAIASIMEAAANTGFVGEAQTGRMLRYDFSYFNLQPNSFPVRDWARALTDALYDVGGHRMTSYPTTTGATEFQKQVAGHLARTRGVRCQPEQIVAFPGTEYALDAIMRLIPGEPRTFGMEEPGYDLAFGVAQRRGLKVAPLPTEHGAECFLQEVADEKPDVMFTTPSHQFPTGTLMTLPTRIELLRLSEQLGFYIIEDDSCYEYRYGTGPVPSLQSLDAGNKVVYLGNFSKTLTPALRVSFAVLPPELLERYYVELGPAIPSVNTHIQDALARFIAAGALDRHVRRMVAGNRERHDLLLECLTSSFGDAITLSGIDSGMHFFAAVHNGMNQDELVATARANDAAVYGTHRFWFSREAPNNTLMIGFSSIALEDIEPGVAALAAAWL